MLHIFNNNKLAPACSMAVLLCSGLILSSNATADPKANADQYTTDANQSITFNPLQNDSADNGTYIFARWVTQPETANSGSTSFTANSITYTPANGFTGTPRFWYSIADSTGKITGAHIRVTVGDAPENFGYPTAGNDNLTTRQDTPLTISPLINDTGNQLRITAVNAYSTQGSRQSIVGTDQISYTPSANASGADVFWYQITDSQGRRNAAKVTVAVTNGNNAGAYPTAGSDNYTVDKNTTNNQFNVFANDTGSGLKFNNLYAYTEKGGRTFDNGSRGVIYDPPRNFVGTDTFWYAIEDSIGRTNSAKVTITVNDTNNGGENIPPNAVEDSLPSTINAPEFEIDVLANDTDENGDDLVVQNVEAARSGSVRLVNGRVLYTPPSTVASDTFRYTVSDGRGGTDSTSVTIGVRDPDDPNPNNPVVENEYVTMSAGETIIIKVLENDSDADGDILSLDQVTSGSQGSTRKVADDDGNLNWVEYTALPTATGTDVFYYGVPDGRGGNGSGKVTITFR